MSSPAVDAVLPRRSRDAVALVTARGTLTVGAFLARVNRYAAALEQVPGVVAGRRVMVPTDTAEMALPMLVACAVGGVIGVPWRPRQQSAGDVVTLVRPAVMTAFEPDGSPRFTPAPILDVTQEVWPGTLIVLTSGSTGEPKGVLLSMQQVVRNGTVAGQSLGVESLSRWCVDLDVALMSALGHFVMAWCADLPLWHLAGLLPARRAEAFRPPGVGFGGAPLQLLQLAEQPLLDCAPALMVGSGDFMGAAILSRLWERLPSSRVAKFYGLTEVAGRLCLAPDDLLRERPEVAGRRLPGFTLSYAEPPRNSAEQDSRELQVESDMLFFGYCSVKNGFRPRSTGPFRTGDLGACASDGVVTLHGRVDDVFKVAGEKVDRRTIESVATEVLQTTELCVLPVPNARLGRVPALFVSVSSLDAAPEWASTVAALRERLPTRFVPALMYAVEGALPRTDTGKVDRQRLLDSRKHYQIFR